MSMCLEIVCPHCGAKVGKFCKRTYEVNGEKIKILIKALDALDLSIKDLRIQN